jgi:hypothetical protein
MRNKDFYDFLITKAGQYGHQCHHCGGNDGYFALNEKCVLCGASLIRYGKELSLLFSLEAFIEFIDHHVEKADLFKKPEVRELLEQTIKGLKEPTPKVDVDALTQLQKYFTSGAKIEGGIIEGTLILNNTGTEIISNADPATTLPGPNLDGLIGAIFAIQIITIVKFKK